ncbi:MAG: hypothetical protein WC050_02165 [Candidatus Paceibacterota bacterium]
MALIFAASLFVPQWARAEMPSIESGISLTNELIADKASKCTPPNKAVCEKAYDDLIATMRRVTAAQKKLAKARLEGNRAQEFLALNEIKKLSATVPGKVDYIKFDILKLPKAAGK